MERRIIQITIVNKNGEPIIGANVIRKVQINGIITGIDGKFVVLSVDPTSTLQISYIGYQRKEVGVYENVLNEIEKQTDYLFVYNKNVDVDVMYRYFSKLDLQEALKNIFGVEYQYEIDERYVLLSSNKRR